MLPQTSSIWQHDLHPTASGKPGAVQYKRISGIGRYQSTAKFACVAFFHQHVPHGLRHVLVKKEMHAPIRTT